MEGMMGKMQYDSGMDEDLVQTRLTDDLGIITMNHPHKLNCFSTDLVAGILKAFDDFERAQVRVIILRAYPGIFPLNNFCAGSVIVRYRSSV